METVEFRVFTSCGPKFQLNQSECELSEVALVLDCHMFDKCDMPFCCALKHFLSISLK